MGMLNRYLQGKREEINKLKKKRPYLVSEVKKLNEADKWRYQLLKEIAKKMGEIQNRGLGEHKIRKLNDEINLLFREKIHWERRIQELGGPNYTNLTKTTKSNAKSNKIIDLELSIDILVLREIYLASKSCMKMKRLVLYVNQVV